MVVRRQQPVVSRQPHVLPIQSWVSRGREWFLSPVYRLLPATASGFTLVEVVVAISAFTIILVSVAAFQRDVFFLNRALQTSLESQQEARKTLKEFTAELRSASPSTTGAYPLADAKERAITFYSDRDDDGLVDRLRYFLDGTTFKKGTLEPTGNPPAYDNANEAISVAVHDVGSATIFAYFGAAYDGTTAPLPTPVAVTDVRLVKATLAIDRDPARPPAPFVVTTQVSLRNLKEN